jgi:hypothetical protein
MNKRNCRNYKIHGDQTTYFWINNESLKKSKGN